MGPGSVETRTLEILTEVLTLGGSAEVRPVSTDNPVGGCNYL